MANTKHIRNARQGGDFREEIADGLCLHYDPDEPPIEFCPDCGETEYCSCLEDDESWYWSTLEAERREDEKYYVGPELDDYGLEPDWDAEHWELDISLTDQELYELAVELLAYDTERERREWEEESARMEADQFWRF